MSITRKFLKEMGLAEEQAEAIIQAHRETVDALKAEAERLGAPAAELEEARQQLARLQARYDADTGTLRQQLADRDYSDAITRAIAGAGLQFSSKSARTAFEAALRERKPELKDGTLADFDRFVEEQRQADPAAFAGSRPAPRFAERVGLGGPPAGGKSRAAEIARQYHNDLYGTKKEEKI